MRDFHGAVVVVTGAGAGIGRATAQLFREHGAKVHVVDCDVQRAEHVVEALGGTAADVTMHQADVREAGDMERVADAVYARHGHCDVLVNNAGVGHGGRIHETSLSDWRWVIDTNLWGVIHGIHAFVPRMIEARRPAHVVNVASLAGLVGLPAMAPYCASKFAVVGLSESLGVELAAHNIGVSAICPGIVDTDVIRSARWGGGDALKERIVAFYRRRGIAPQRVARDILAAVRQDRPLQLSVGIARPALWFKRISPRGFRRVVRFVARRFAEGVSR